MRLSQKLYHIFLILLVWSLTIVKQYYYHDRSYDILYRAYIYNVNMLALDLIYNIYYIYILYIYSTK